MTFCSLGAWWWSKSAAFRHGKMRHIYCGAANTCYWPYHFKVSACKCKGLDKASLEIYIQYQKNTIQYFEELLKVFLIISLPLPELSTPLPARSLAPEGKLVHCFSDLQYCSVTFLSWQIEQHAYLKIPSSAPCTCSGTPKKKNTIATLGSLPTLSPKPSHRRQ